MTMRAVAIFLAVFILAFGHAGTIEASQTTPESGLCSAEPRHIEAIADLAATPAAEPLAFSETDAAPPDGAQLAEIRATIEAAIDCANGNDPLRALAYFTDRYVAERFGNAHPDDLASLTAAASRQPVPATEEDQLSIVALTDGQIGASGSVARIEVQTTNGSASFTDRLVLVKNGDHWSIDSWEPIEETQGTPAASA
jgi:hypothetical protein